ncbi:hypothetical protein MIR68_001991 [Amoeboaphelidium protococcarum]|nr:hypothetical protein MIR68_001991 [Amoeboaphelidium protococcarum]
MAHQNVQDDKQILIQSWISQLNSDQFNVDEVNYRDLPQDDLLLLLNMAQIQYDIDRGRQNVITLIKHLLEQKLVDIQLLLRKLDGDLLADLNLVDAKAFHRKAVKISTRLFYKQEKFNLLCEESEGYSKLLTLLSRFNGDVEQSRAQTLSGKDAVEHNDIFPQIETLIGQFNLDPNRTLSLVLDAFGNNLQQNELYISLISHWSNRSELESFSRALSTHMAFKLRHEGGGELTLAVAAYLIKGRLMNMEDIYGYLSPVKDDFEFSAHVSTTTDNNSNNDIDQKKELTKFRLCIHLFKVGDIQSALMVLNEFPDLVQYSPAVVKEFCYCLVNVIRPLYQSCCVLPRLVNVNSLHKQFASSQPLMIVQDMDTLIEQVFPLLNLLKESIGCDSVLCQMLSKLAAVGMKDSVVGNRKLWLRVISECLLPGLCVNEDSPGVINCEIWNIFCEMSYSVRYTLYGDWMAKYDASPKLSTVKDDVVQETKKIMRRISKDNVRQFGRQLAKLSSRNPLLVFDVVLDQLQVYENMIQPMVDSFAYMTSLTYDTLIYCIVSKLASGGSRIKEDGMNVSSWLSSLSSLTSNLIIKCDVDFTGLLQYVLKQMIAGQVVDLVILKDILSLVVGNAVLLENGSMQQLEAMSCGPMMKSQLLHLQSEISPRRIAIAADRLLAALTKQNLAGSLLECILVVKTTPSFDINGNNKHVKLISSLHDQTQLTLLFLVHFLTRNVTEDVELQNILPSIDKLLQLNVQDADIWHVYRGTLSKQLRNVLTADAGSSDSSILVQQLQVLPDVICNTRCEQLPLCNELFYKLFWSLDLGMINDCAELYAEQIGKYQNEPGKLGIADSLQSELYNRQSEVRNVVENLKAVATQLFIRLDNRNDIGTQAYHYCFRSRALLSPLDALFAARFFWLLLDIDAPLFSHLTVIDKIVHDLQICFFSCSQMEAANMGIFLNEILSKLSTWYQDEDLYKGQAQFHHGFKQKWSSDAEMNRQLPDEETSLKYQDFQYVVQTFFKRVRLAVVASLESACYTSIRNCIIMLDKMKDVFPLFQLIGSNLEQRISRALAAEIRDDLKVLLTRYLAVLGRNKQQWIKMEVDKRQVALYLDGSSMSLSISSGSVGSRSDIEEDVDEDDRNIEHEEVESSMVSGEDQSQHLNDEQQSQESSQTQQMELENSKVTDIVNDPQEEAIDFEEGEYEEGNVTVLNEMRDEASIMMDTTDVSGWGHLGVSESQDSAESMLSEELTNNADNDAEDGAIAVENHSKETQVVGIQDGQSQTPSLVKSPLMKSRSRSPSQSRPDMSLKLDTGRSGWNVSPTPEQRHSVTSSLRYNARKESTAQASASSSSISREKSPYHETRSASERSRSVKADDNRQKRVHVEDFKSYDDGKRRRLPEQQQTSVHSGGYGREEYYSRSQRSNDDHLRQHSAQRGYEQRSSTSRLDSSSRSHYQQPLTASRESQRSSRYDDQSGGGRGRAGDYRDNYANQRRYSGDYHGRQDSRGLAPSSAVSRTGPSHLQSQQSSQSQSQSQSSKQARDAEQLRRVALASMNRNVRRH